MLTEEDSRRWDNDVAPIGTWMSGRRAFMVEPAERGTPFAIHGNRWIKTATAGSRRQPLDQDGNRWIKTATAGSRRQPLDQDGNRWIKSPEWPSSSGIKAPSAKSDEDHAHAIQSAKTCLGLLSKGNRDLHTTRSLEIPALGGLLCAERTVEHQWSISGASTDVLWGEEAVF